MISYKVRGDWKRTRNFLNRIRGGDIYANLESYAREGLEALRSATPVDTGKTASSWEYEIKKKGDQISIEWTNSNRIGGTPIVILLQYGHGTGTGGYVRGRDFINPAIRPVFDKIANGVWKEVCKD